MADNFQAIPPSGDPLARKDYLGAVAAGVIDYLVFEPVSRIAVRRSGDMAALRYKVSFNLVAGGTRVTHKGWITELWKRRNGTLADRLGAGHRDPEQLRPVPPVDRTARALVSRAGKHGSLTPCQASETTGGPLEALWKRQMAVDRSRSGQFRYDFAPELRFR